MGHFDCIGYRWQTQDQFGDGVMEAATTGTRVTGPLGDRVTTTDPSGGIIAAFLVDGGIRCAKPSFTPATALPVEVTGRLDDPNGCPFCAITLVEIRDPAGEMLYPLPLELDDAHLGAPDPGPLAIAVTGFVEQLERWPDEAAHQAASGGGETIAFATRSLVPSGMFTPGGGDRARAEAIVGGVVVDAQRRRSDRTGDPFDWCRVETYGITLDLVAAAQPQPFAPGEVLQTTCWLVGHRVS
jgi:hypothetical protein